MFEEIFLPIIILFIFVCICCILYRRLWMKKPTKFPPIPRLGKRDFKLDELKFYNGDGVDRRILIAVNGAPYEILAGRDASRALACFSTDRSIIKDEYDDLSDLTPDQMNCLSEWELQFSERYDYIGRLLKPGESHRVYEDDQFVQTLTTSQNDSKDFKLD